MQSTYWTLTKIFNFRRKYRLSQKTLGTCLGISPYTIYAWETGRRSPTAMATLLLDRIAKDIRLERGF